MTNNNTNKATL